MFVWKRSKINEKEAHFLKKNVGTYTKVMGISPAIVKLANLNLVH